MGIKGLMQLLRSEAPDSFKETDKKAYISKVIAIDASIQLYQFLVQIRIKEGSGPSKLLTDDSGLVTSHLQGFFNRTANLLENGIKPVFVFDGKPPKLKYSELEKRKESKSKAEKELKDATERAENAEDSDTEATAFEDMDKAAKRNIHVTKQQTEEVKHLLRLMGLPIIEAPCEAEAQCAELVKKGKVFAAATEDMDSLTFGTSIVLRKLTMPENHKEKVIEIHISKVLAQLGLNYEEFIDFCILSGCDYCETIKGIGSKNALKLIKKHKNIESIIENLSDKYKVPKSLEDNLNTIRELFKNPNVIPANDIELIFTGPDIDGILQFLVEEKGFNSDRVKKVIDKITKIDKNQTAIDMFFKNKKTIPKPTVIKPVTNKPVTIKPVTIKPIASGIEKQISIDSFFKTKKSG
jgi:flap endonuclease-1